MLSACALAQHRFLGRQPPQPPARRSHRHPRAALRVSALRASEERALSLQEAHKLFVAKKLPVIDVRSPKEFRNEALAGAVNVELVTVPRDWPLGFIDPALGAVWDDPEKMPPFNEAFERQVRDVLKGDISRPALLICSNGQRSAEAVDLLDSVGMEKVFWVAGGLKAWLGRYSVKGVERPRATKGVYKDEGPNIWTDSAEEDTVLPLASGEDNTLDLIHDGEKGKN